MDGMMVVQEDEVGLVVCFASVVPHFLLSFPCRGSCTGCRPSGVYHLCLLCCIAWVALSCDLLSCPFPPACAQASLSSFPCRAKCFFALPQFRGQIFFMSCPCSGVYLQQSFSCPCLSVCSFPQHLFPLAATIIP